MRLLPGIILLAPLLVFSQTADPQSLNKQTALDKIIHAYGGEKNLRRLDHVVQEWDFFALTGNRHGTDVRSIRIPDQLKVELTYPDKSDAVSLEIDGEFCALSLVENGVRADYLVNMETWRIEKVVGTLSVNGTKMQFLTEYSDFKYVDGILVHQKENKYAGGVNTAKLKLSRITFNADFDEGTFSFR